jgi:AcrR family transcriptional regulator
MEATSRREGKKQRNRDALLKAAEELFSEKGFKSSTMQQISEKAGLAKGSTYLYFKSKEELFTTVCLKGIQGFGESLEDAANGAQGLEEKIKAVYLAYARHSLQEPSIFRVLRDTFIEPARQNLSHDTIEQISGYIRLWLEFESGLVQQGIEAGLFDASVDPYNFSVMAWRLSTGIIELALLKDPIVITLEDVQGVFESSIDILIKGIKASS